MSCLVRTRVSVKCLDFDNCTHPAQHSRLHYEDQTTKTDQKPKTKGKETTQERQRPPASSPRKTHTQTTPPLRHNHRLATTRTTEQRQTHLSPNTQFKTTHPNPQTSPTQPSMSHDTIPTTQFPTSNDAHDAQTRSTPTPHITYITRHHHPSPGTPRMTEFTSRRREAIGTRRS